MLERLTVIIIIYVVVVVVVVLICDNYQKINCSFHVDYNGSVFSRLYKIV